MTADDAGPEPIAQHHERRRLRWFASKGDEPRSRRATDVLLLIAAVIGIAFLSLVAAPPAGFERAMTTLVRAIPTGLDGLWQLGLDALALLAIGIVVSTLVRRRITLARDVLLAVLFAIGMSLLIGRIVGGSWPIVWNALRSGSRPMGFPPMRLAAASSIVMTASPHLTQPARRIGRWVISGGAVAAALLGAATPVGVAAGLLVAAMSAAAVHLALGSPAGRPSLADVAAALDELGVDAASLDIDARQPTGVFLVDAVDERGDALLVKVYGRDAHDTQLVTTMWRTVLYREPGSPVSLRRLQQVEHEAFITLLVHQSGLLTDRVVTAGATADDDAVLVLRRAGTRLSEAPQRWNSSLAILVWDMLEELHGLGVAHGQLDAHHLITDGEQLGFVDFRGATVAPTEQRLLTDRAQALVSTIVAIGAEPALAIAVEQLGAERLVELLPFLQESAVTSRQRSALPDGGIDLDAIRADAAAVAGVEPPKLQQLRRVTLGSVLQPVLLVIAFSVLASGIAGLDLDELWQQVVNARWWFVAVGLAVAQVPRLPQAVSSMGASPIALALAPLYVLQLALSYVGLALPGSGARFAFNVRFFQRKGMPAGTAVAASALDSTFWFIVLGGLLGAIVTFTPASLDLDLDTTAPAGLVRLVLVVVGLGLAALLVVLLVPAWRRSTYGQIRKLLSDAGAAAKGLRSPRRLAMLLGGNVATALLFAAALGAFTLALGYPVPFIDLLLIHVSVSLLAGILPVPGGIGVVEGGLTFGLARAGLPEDTAFAAALMFRIATFYLPPLWGAFALRWLKQNKHL